MIQHSDGSWSQEKEFLFSRRYPLHHACRDSKVEFLKHLLVQLQQNISNSHLVLAEDPDYGWTAAHFAAYFGSLECLRVLEQAGKVLNSSRQSAGLPPLPCPLQATTSKFQQSLLHVTAFASRPNCVQWLLQGHLNVNLQDNHGETALHKACRSGTWDCVQLLLTGHADPSIRNNKGCDPAELAASSGYPGIAQRLRQHVDASVPSTSASINHLVSSNGYYGFTAAPTTSSSNHCNGSSNGTSSTDVDMEASSGAHSVVGEASAAPVECDLLMSEAVAQDTIPVAGRKRGREAEECQQSKRGRYQEPPFVYDHLGDLVFFTPRTPPRPQALHWTPSRPYSSRRALCANQGFSNGNTDGVVGPLRS